VIFWHAFLVERENEKKKEKKKISLISRRSLSPSDFSAAYDSKCLFVSLSLPLIFLHRRAIGFISSRGAPLPRCGAPARAPLLAAATRLLWCAPLLHHRTPLVAPAPLHGLHPWPLSIVPGRSQAPSSSFGFSLPSTFLAARALVRAHPCRAPSASLPCPRSPRSRAVAQLTLSHGRAKPLPPWPAVVSPCAASSQFNLELLRLSLDLSCPCSPSTRLGQAFLFLPSRVVVRLCIVCTATSLIPPWCLSSNFASSIPCLRFAHAQPLMPLLFASTLCATTSSFSLHVLLLDLCLAITLCRSTVSTTCDSRLCAHTSQDAALVLTSWMLN
jgi:hypothetical protein